MSRPNDSWRESRRRAAQDAIVKAAWEIVREQGIGGLSIRELALRAGITTPTVYAYFESKNAIFDAMFAQGNREALDALAAITEPDFATFLKQEAWEFHRFSTSDPARYQLLFQRTIPGFEPSAESYALAVGALDEVRRRFHEAGLDDRALDLWSCIATGIVSQQLANDPGGDRYEQLIDEAVEMFLSHVGYRKPVKGKGKGKR